jgi:hypothetical protein
MTSSLHRGVTRAVTSTNITPNPCGIGYYDKAIQTPIRRRARTPDQEWPLGYVYVKLRQPILKGLHGKAAENEADAERSQPSLGKVVGIVLDVGIHRDSKGSDNASHEPDAKSKRPGVVNVMHQHTTDERRSGVANGANYCAPELAARKAGTAIGHIISGRTHVSSVRNHVAEGDEGGKGNCKPKTQCAVKSGAKSQPTDRRKHTLPKQGVVVQAARRSIEFNRQRDAGGYAGSKAKAKTEAKADDRIRHRPGKLTQRPMLAPQQIVSEIQTTKHVETRSTMLGWLRQGWRAGDNDPGCGDGLGTTEHFEQDLGALLAVCLRTLPSFRTKRCHAVRSAMKIQS